MRRLGNGVRIVREALNADRHDSSLSHGVLPCVLLLEFEAETGAAEISADDAVLGNRRAIEQHMLDADVIVEPLLVPE